MAKQAGIIKIKGTIDGICFYKLDGNYYARTKSSLDSKRVKTSKPFRETMRYARLFAKASVIGSTIYRMLPKDKRSRNVYQQLTGKAMKMLKDDLSEKEVIKKLKKML
jgi:ribosomal protein L13